MSAGGSSVSNVRGQVAQSRLQRFVTSEIKADRPVLRDIVLGRHVFEIPGRIKRAVGRRSLHRSIYPLNDMSLKKNGEQKTSGARMAPVFNRDSPDDCRSAMNIRVFRPYYKTDASSGRASVRRAIVMRSQAIDGRSASK